MFCVGDPQYVCNSSSTHAASFTLHTFEYFHVTYLAHQFKVFDFVHDFVGHGPSATNYGSSRDINAATNANKAQEDSTANFNSSTNAVPVDYFVAPRIQNSRA